MSPIVRIRWTVLVAALLVSSWVGAGACKPARYQVMGRVIDGAGRPLADASVRLLLDQVSAQEFAAHGPRARLIRANAFGKYTTLIDCDAARGVTDAPNPCAAKPRYLSVAVEAPGHRSKWVVFRLKDLEILHDDGGCLVQVPDVKLSNN